MQDTTSSTSTTAIARLARRATTIPGATPCGDVERLFTARPELDAVALRRSDDGVVPLMRDRFLGEMAGPLGFGRALHHRRPVEDIVRDVPLVLPARMELAEAEAAALTREGPRRYDHVAVSLPDGETGLLTMADLLGELARVYRHRALHDPLTGLANRAHFLMRLEQVARPGPG